MSKTVITLPEIKKLCSPDQKDLLERGFIVTVMIRGILHRLERNGGKFTKEPYKA